jgi:hypothetical protein
MRPSLGKQWRRLNDRFGEMWPSAVGRVLPIAALRGSSCVCLLHETALGQLLPFAGTLQPPFKRLLRLGQLPFVPKNIPDRASAIAIMQAESRITLDESTLQN